MLDGNSPPPPPHYFAYGSVYVSKLLSQFFPKCVHKSVLYVSICIPALNFLTTANIISIRCYSIFAKIKVEIRVAGWDRVTFAHGKELHILCFLFVKRNALLGGSAEELPTPHHGIHTFFFLICSLTSTDIYRMSVMGQAPFLALGIK